MFVINIWLGKSKNVGIHRKANGFFVGFSLVAMLMKNNWEILDEYFTIITNQYYNVPEIDLSVTSPTFICDSIHFIF